MEKEAKQRAEISPLGVMLRIQHYARPYTKFILLGLVGIVGSQLLAVVIPQILRFVIDRGIERQDQAYMFQAGLLVVGLGVLRGGMGFLARYFTEAQSHRVAYDIRNAMYDKVQRLSFSYHDRAQTGSLITRGISDVDEIQRFLAFGLLDGLNTILIVAFAGFMMLTTSPLLAIIALLPLIPLIPYSQRFADFVDHAWRKIMERLANLGNHLQENVVGAEVVRAFAREDHEIKRFEEENQRLYDDHMNLINRWSSYVPTSSTLVATSITLTLIAGALMIREGYGGVTTGIIVQFNAYILLMSQPLRFVGFVIMLINQGVASGRRVFEILDEREMIDDKPDAIALPRINGVMRFEGVSFRFQDDLPLVLHDINIETEPGQVIAVIGKTGAGKSALMSLIPRFYEVSAGRLTIDGHDVRDVTLTSLRDQIGIVLQESLLFSATIRENIAFGQPDADDETIFAAARAANAHDFIMEFPQGYDTMVGERGVTVSGGQRQRIAIARAILVDPRILILDDATSSVDTHTEAQIQEALQRLMVGRTTFIVAQRLTSVIHADQIIVLDNGRIAERGKHDDLLAKGGLYKEIYDLQLADQDRERRATLRYESGAFSDLSRVAGD